jgi:hypothetical protein
VAAWVAAIFAAVSGLFAGLTFYWAYLKSPAPFEPMISLGNPILKDVSGILSIVMRVPITNNGGEAGCVADVALRVESKSARTQWSYFPAWQINLERYLRGVAVKEDPFLAVEAPVSPLPLPGKAAKDQVILFMPRPASAPKLEPLRAKDLVAGEAYLVSVFLVHAPSDCAVPQDAKYQVHGTREFVLTDDQIKEISRGTAVMPLDTSRDTSREQFIRKR